MKLGMKYAPSIGVCCNSTEEGGRALEESEGIPRQSADRELGSSHRANRHAGLLKEKR